MKSRLILVWILFVAAAVVVPAQTMIDVSNKQYVLPVSELLTTKTYPDIITVTGAGIEAQLLPNRGRLLSGIRVKSAGVSALYQSFNPVPMVLKSGLHAVEFGGYYLSIPWNTRDRQPYDLNYRIVENSADRASVDISGEDILKRLSAASVVVMRYDRALVDIRSTIKNETKTRTIREPDFYDVLLLSPREETGGNAQLLLPSESVTVIESKDNWVGPQQQSVPWTDALSRWSSVKGYYEVKAATSSQLPCFAILYPDQNLALVKTWSPADYFEAVDVVTYGPSYKQEAGIGAYFRVSCHKTNLELEPQAQTEFRSAFVVIQNVEEGISLRSLYELAAAEERKE